MSSSHDPFSALFDAIDVDIERAPAQAAFDHALAIATPSAADFTAPGFYLLDDAAGRFDVDREFGVITLKDEGILEHERDSIHTARLRVIELSGASYDLDMRLRLTGRVPQMVGAEENAFLVALAAGETQQAAPAPALRIVASAPPPDAPKALVSWTKYAAAHALPGKTELMRTRRAFIAAELPAIVSGPAALAIDEILPPVGLPDRWLD